MKFTIFEISKTVNIRNNRNHPLAAVCANEYSNEVLVVVHSRTGSLEKSLRRHRGAGACYLNNGSKRQHNNGALEFYLERQLGYQFQSSLTPLICTARSDVVEGRVIHAH